MYYRTNNLNLHRRGFGCLKAATTVVLAALPSCFAAGAGTWGDPGTSTFIGNAFILGNHDITSVAGCIPCPINESCDSPGQGNCPLIGFIPGAFGWSFARQAHAHHDCDGPFGTHCTSHAASWANATVGGVGTSVAEIRWDVHAASERRCDCINYGFTSSADLNTTIDLVIDTVPPGEPVTIFFSWYALVNRQTEHEAGAEDPASVEGLNGAPNVTFDLTTPSGPTSLISGVGVDANATTPNAFLFLPGNPALSTGIIAAHGGDVITIDLKGAVSARIAAPPITGTTEDQAFAGFTGQLLLSIDAPLPPFQNPAVPGASINEFSVKIGSDSEMSDPPPLNGNEVFDPGDTYPWYGPSLPSCGADGVRDDALAFTVDYWPQAPDCIADPLQGGTGGESCSVPFNNFNPLIVEDRFDLDGTDALDVALWPDVIPPGPVTSPIVQFPSNCIYGPNPYLLISYADDSPHHYAVDFCQIPSESPSSISRTYGTDAKKDELVMIIASALSGGPQVNFGGTVPIHSEALLHPSLAPNPDPAVSQREDDDVDALDVNVNINAQCEHWYISADKEATGLYQNMPLDPASIYQVIPTGGMVKVIDGQIHLGLQPGTDLNAFEFVWLRTCDPADPTNCQIVLGLLFSVDEFDGFGVLDLMPGDESGGLDPTKIYASLLDGTHFEYAPEPLTDNVDAIAASPLPFVAAGAVTLINDNCVGRVQVGTGVTVYANQNATTDGPIEPCGFQGDIAGNSDADIWYEFIAPCDGLATFSFEPQYDQLVAIYHQACPQQGGAVLACEAIPVGAIHPFTLGVIAGESYIIRIGGVGGQQGYGTLTIACPCDNFNTYNPFYLLTAQSAWEPWGGAPAAGNFFVTSAQAQSAPYSVAIDGADDAVHRYYDRNAGQWTYRAWVYVPTGMDAKQYFVLLNTYPPIDPEHWSLQIELDGVNDTIDDLDSSDSLPIIRDQWVQIRVEIDLANDEQSVYYDGQLLVAKGWTDGVAPGGALNIGAVDLWGNNSTEVVYYDDFCLEPGPASCGPDLDCDGDVDFDDFTQLLASWGNPGCGGSLPCPADLDGDGDVDFDDFTLLLASWGP